MSDEGTVEVGSAGRDVLETASLLEGMIDEDGLLLEENEQETDPPEEIEEEAESEDGDSDESDEVEVDDVDDDEDSEEPSDPADEDEEPARLELDDDALDSLVTIKVNGEEEEVPLREALAGTMRQKAFTLKTQELAEQRKAVEAEAAAKRQERQKYADGLKQLETVMSSVVPEEPDWEAVKAERPDTYPEEFQAYQQHKKNLEAIKAEQARVQKEAAEEAELAMLQKQQERDEFLTATIPGWSDLEKARSEMAELVEYAQENYGYKLEDISRTVDPNAFLLLRKAKLYDEMSEKGEKVRKKAKKTPVLKPGSTTSKKSSEKKRREAARSRLSKTGSLEDAAEVFKDFIE